MAATSWYRSRRLIIDVEKCTGCLICQLRCSFRFKKEFDPSSSAIVIQRILGTDNEYAVSFTQSAIIVAYVLVFARMGHLPGARVMSFPKDTGFLQEAHCKGRRKYEFSGIRWQSPVHGPHPGGDSAGALRPSLGGEVLRRLEHKQLAGPRGHSSTC